MIKLKPIIESKWLECFSRIEKRYVYVCDSCLHSEYEPKSTCPGCGAEMKIRRFACNPIVEKGGDIRCSSCNGVLGFITDANQSATDVLNGKERCNCCGARIILDECEN